MDRAIWQNRTIVSTLLIVFLAGAMAGALTVKLTKSVASAYTKEPTKEELLDRFTRELELTPDQESRIKDVLDDYMKYIQTLEAQMADVRATGKKRILEILNDKQDEQFLKNFREMQKK